MKKTCALLGTPDLVRLFEPFYRTDASRSAETGGNGLGLAICRAIADTAGWAVRLERDAEGIVATVEFAGPMHAAAR